MVDKEPWQMTPEELKPLTDAGKVESWQTTLEQNVAFSKSKGIGAEGLSRITSLHKRAVQQALSEGKPVSPEVLKDYPELRPNPNLAEKGYPKIPESRIKELKNHEELVLQAVKDKPDITFPELEQVTKLDAPQIGGALRRLDREGILQEKESKMTPGGLIPSSYKLKSNPTSTDHLPVVLVIGAGLVFLLLLRRSRYS